MATPTLPTSPSARAWSESNPIWVGRSNAHDSPVWPASSRNLNRSLVASAVPKPAYWRIVQSRCRYIVGVDPARVGVLPGLAEAFGRVPAIQVVRAVDRADRYTGVGPVLLGGLGFGGHDPRLEVPRPGAQPGGAAPAEEQVPAHGPQRGWGMHSSSYSAITISPAFGPHAAHSGSRRTLKVRNDSSSAS